MNRIIDYVHKDDEHRVRMRICNKDGTGTAILSVSINDDNSINIILVDSRDPLIAPLVRFACRDTSVTVQ